jgi:hypothetical protein
VDADVVAPRESDQLQVTMTVASSGCSGPTIARAVVVFVPVSSVCESSASIFGNCHSYTVASSRVAG